VPKTSLTAVERRAEELDTIASVLPLERRDELAELLTDEDVETLRHLVNQGMGDNTLRALTSDLTYLEAWGLASTGQSLPWPAPEALLLKFVAHHLWDLEKRAGDPNHGMPADVDENLRRQGFLKSIGPHAPDTVRRMMHANRGAIDHRDAVIRRARDCLHQPVPDSSNGPTPESIIARCVRAISFW